MAAIGAFATLAAAGATLLMTTVDYPGSSEVRLMVDDMKDTSQWLAWVLVLAIQTAVWIALAPAMFGAARESKIERTNRQIAHALALLALLVAPFAAFELFNPSHPVQAALHERMTALMAAALLADLPGVVAIVRAHADIEGLKHRAATKRPGDLQALVTDYAKLRARLHFVGGALALIVALGVLATGGQRNAVVAMESARATTATAAAEILKEDGGSELVTRQACPAQDPSAESSSTFGNTPSPTRAECLAAAAVATRRATRFGVEAVWSFGLYYVFVLMLVYLPSYLSLAETGRTIRDLRYPLSLPGQPSGDNAARAELTEILQLEKSPLESLKAATLVLFPLVTSLATSLLGGVEIGG